MIKWIRYLLNCIVGAAVVGLAVIFLLPRVFGYRPYMVVSASMQQSFPVGSLIFVRQAEPEDIQVNDPITFEWGSLTVTHRVVEIRHDERVFITKGDNNNTTEVTPFENLRGKALNFCLPNMGYFSAWFITWQGRSISAILILSTAALSVVLGKIDELDDNPQDEAAVGTKEGEGFEQ